MLYPLIDWAQRTAARSRALTRLAALVRNQCNCVIGYRHAASSQPDVNGERWLLEFAAPSSRSFIDVGANVGRWSSDFLAYAPADCRGLLFEPSAAARAALPEAIRRDPRLAVIAAAVGDRPGELTFAEEPGAGETSSLVPGVSRATATRTAIRVVTLDDEAAGRGWETIDFLKIDTEGYDFHVLRGAARLLSRGAVRLVQFEYNSSWAAAGSTLAAALHYLNGHGYSAYVLRPDGLYHPNLARFGDFFRYCNFVAVAPSSAGLVQGKLRGAI